jgi:hypothetical protein
MAYLDLRRSSGARFTTGLKTGALSAPTPHAGRGIVLFFVSLKFFVGHDMGNIIIIYTVWSLVVLGIDKRR